MRAIILAAGIGKRLGEISGGKPKCLLEFDGISLLHRHIAILRQLGICDILIVTGYCQDDIATELDSLKSDARINTAYNPYYESGSVVSLWTARSCLESGDDIILMDADVLYHPDIIRTLINTKNDNCFLLDRDFEAGDEPVKICVQGSTIVDFRKQIDSQLQFDFQGESVGFFDLAAKFAINWHSDVFTMLITIRKIPLMKKPSVIYYCRHRIFLAMKMSVACPGLKLIFPRM